MKFFYKTKLLIIGKYFQPLEPIESIKHLELILNTKAQRHEVFLIRARNKM